MSTAEQLQEEIELRRSLIDAFLDDDVTGGVDITAAAALLTEAKHQLASRNRVHAIAELLREDA